LFVVDLRQILTYKLVSAYPLFNGDLKTHTNKPVLAGDIAPRHDLTQWYLEYTVAMTFEAQYDPND